VLYARLAALGESEFERYRTSVMPRELKMDPKFREELGGPEDDGSHINLAFLRWQKRVFAQKWRLPVEELNWDGRPVPMFKGISYQWKELYDSLELQVLTKRVEAMATQFLQNIQGDRALTKFRTMPWVEVFRPGDFQWPHVRTGAAVYGVFFARHAENSSELVFDDVRGDSPPFGHQHTHHPEQGELVLFPSWASHKLTPNQGSTNNVYYRFLLWPPRGAPDFDWEDDPTGDYVFKKMTNVRRTLPEQAPAKTPSASTLPAESPPPSPGHGGEL